MSCPILIVDDDEDARFLLSVMLKRRGFEADVCDDAASCLARLDTISSCVVITDVQMPGMSGLELCAAVRDRHPGTVAIVISGAASPTIAIEAMEVGAFRFLPKPVGGATLEAALTLAMDVASATAKK